MDAKGLAHKIIEKAYEAPSFELAIRHALIGLIEQRTFLSALEPSTGKAGWVPTAEQVRQYREEGAKAAIVDCAKAVAMLPFDTDDFHPGILNQIRARLNGCSNTMEMEAGMSAEAIVASMPPPGAETPKEN